MLKLYLPYGHGYKVTCYSDNYGGASIVLTEDTPNLSTISYANIISNITIEEIIGIVIYTEANYTGGYLSYEQPGGFSVYGTYNGIWWNDTISSIYIPAGYGYRFIGYENWFSGGSISITASVPDLTTIAYNNTCTTFYVELLPGIRIFKKNNLYGERLYLETGNYILSEFNWQNCVNSITINAGYKAICYLTVDFTGTYTILT